MLWPWMALFLRYIGCFPDWISWNGLYNLIKLIILLICGSFFFAVSLLPTQWGKTVF